MLPGLILRRISIVRKRCVIENEAGLHPGQGCVDQIFTQRQSGSTDPTEESWMQVIDGVWMENRGATMCRELCAVFFFPLLSSLFSFSNLIPIVH